MNFNEELRTILQKEASNHAAPPELKETILNQVVFRQGGRRMKKWLVASIVAATLLIPSGVYAGYNYLADSMYGSQENIGVTDQQYNKLEAKLQSAKQSFNEEEFTKLMSLLKELGEYNLKMADAEGVVHLDRLNTDEQKAYKSLNAELEPYFERLNEVEIPRASAPTVDINTIWDELLDKAKQNLSEEEYSDVQQLINDLNSYNAKVIDSDGSVHMDRLTEADKAEQERLMEELNPYMKKLGFMLQASS